MGGFDRVDLRVERDGALVVKVGLVENGLMSDVKRKGLVSRLGVQWGWRWR